MKIVMVIRSNGTVAMIYKRSWQIWIDVLHRLSHIIYLGGIHRRPRFSFGKPMKNWALRPASISRIVMEDFGCIS